MRTSVTRSSPPGACPTGTTLCGGNCVSNVCPQGQAFNHSTCRCECPTGQELCGGQCVTSCSEGVLDPTTCQCVCPAVSCCCTCGYRDNATGNFIFVCNASNTTITEAQCEQSCQSATPPPGTSLLNFGHACESAASGRLRVCRPIVGSPVLSGYQCEVPTCTPSPT